MTENIQLDDETLRDAKICKEGVDSEFWKVCKRILGGLRDDALVGLTKVDPTDVGTIAQLQKTAQVVDTLIGNIEDTARLI